MQNSNRLLTSLTQDQSAQLLPLLKHVQLDQKKILFDMGESIDVVYFPTSAVVSLVIPLSTGEIIETAMVGNDGVVGAAAALDGKISLSQAIVQLGGYAMTCTVDALKTVAMQEPGLLSLLIRHEQTVYAQAQQSAACIAVHNVEERLCRWLLRARDLARSDALPFTQQFLAEMLGVQRSSVSVVAHTLQQAGFVKYSRGKIEIIDSDGMQQSACECYSAIRAHYEALIGPPPQK